MPKSRTRFLCTRCLRGFFTVDDLIEHLDQIHPRWIEEAQQRIGIEPCPLFRDRDYKVVMANLYEVAQTRFKKAG